MKGSLDIRKCYIFTHRDATAKQSNVDAVDYIPRSTADTWLKHTKGETFLHTTDKEVMKHPEKTHKKRARRSQFGSFNITESDIHKRDENGKTLLHLAAEQGDIVLIDYLLRNGAEIQAKDADGRTPLHVAAYKGDASVVIQLFSHGADIRLPDNKGKTPLHLATSAGGTGAVNYLIANGADLEAKDGEGKIPVQLSSDPKLTKYMEVEMMLRKADEEEVLKQNSTEEERRKQNSTEEEARKRNPRSLPKSLAPAALKPESIIYKRMCRMLDSGPAPTMQLPNSDGQLVNDDSHQLNNILIFMSVCSGLRYDGRTNHRNLLSPQQIVANRMDKVALDAICNFPLE